MQFLCSEHSHCLPMFTITKLSMICHHQPPIPSLSSSPTSPLTPLKRYSSSFLEHTRTFASESLDFIYFLPDTLETCFRIFSHFLQTMSRVGPFYDVPRPMYWKSQPLLKYLLLPVSFLHNTYQLAYFIVSLIYLFLNVSLCSKAFFFFKFVHFSSPMSGTMPGI